jgi:hypothetical protein
VSTALIRPADCFQIQAGKNYRAPKHAAPGLLFLQVKPVHQAVEKRRHQHRRNANEHQGVIP